MDIPTQTGERTLLDAALNAVRALGVRAKMTQKGPKLGDTRADAFVRLEHGGHEALYAVEVKRGLRPGTLGAMLHQLERLGKHGLLVADYVTPPMAETLKARGVPFLDAAGNAYLEYPGVFIWVKGQKPATPAVPLALGRAFQPTGLQVLFALLCNPKAINHPYRELGAMAGVAHGTVGWVIPDLQQQGFVIGLKGTHGKRRLVNRERLLAQWVDAYARQLRPRTLIGRYYVPTLQGWEGWPLAQHGAVWGGEPAGALLTEYLRPGELTVYADKLPTLLAAQQRFMKTTEPGLAAVVEVRRKFWNFPTEAERPDVTPPVLVYADLLATGDGRCIETAKLVYDAHVARLLKEE